MFYDEWVRCRCCYTSENLIPIPIFGSILDVYLFICNSQNLPNDETEIVVCIRCYDFLEKLRRFKIKCLALQEIFLHNLDVKHFDIESILRNLIGDSPQTEYNTEENNENDEIDQIDIQINKVEIDDEDFSDWNIEINDDQVCEAIIPVEENGKEEFSQNKITKRKATWDTNTSSSKLPKLFEEEDQILTHQSEVVHESDKNSTEALLVSNNVDESNQLCNSSIETGEEFNIPKIKLFVCELCAFVTSKNFDFKNHRFKKHTNEGIYVCDYCKYQTNTKISLIQHIQTHTCKQNMPFECNEYSFEKNKASHSKIHTLKNQSDEKPLCCDQCNYRCNIKSDLSKHKRMHFKKRDKPYKCAECLYETTYAKSLKSHTIYKHTVEKPFSCDQCNYCCKTERDLSKHKMIHSKNRDKPNKCGECSYETIHARNLKSHTIYKHTVEKPFSCDQCNYRCKTKHDLSKHKMIHSKNRDKPYKCGECSYETSNARNLKSHTVYKHTVGKIFSCDQCNYRAKTKKKIAVHIRTKH